MTPSVVHADVVVVGAGSAGVAAAVAAAGEGARVLLLEKLGFCGGQAVSAYVGTVCGSYLRTETDLPVWACGGWPRWTTEALARACGTRPARTPEGLWFLPYMPFALRTVLDDAVREAGVDMLFHATVHGARAGEDGWILDVLAYDRPWEVRAAAVVDGTGHATAAIAAGAEPLGHDEPLQAPAYVLHVAGLPRGVGDAAFKMTLLRALTRGVKAGVLPDDALALSVVPGSRRGSRAAFKLGLRGTLADDPRVFSDCELRARALADQVVRWLAREEPGFGELVVVDAAPQVGLRSGRRARTRVVCTAQDLTRHGPRPDGVAHAAWPVERWGADARPRLDLLPEGAVWEIPAGALEVAGLDGVYVAGRTLGADEQALGSARVIGTCWQTGTAAGRLAAGYTRGTPRATVIAGIRASLELDGGQAG